MIALFSFILVLLGGGGGAPSVEPVLVPGFPVSYVQSGTGVPFLASPDLDGDGCHEILHGQVAGFDPTIGADYSQDVIVLTGEGQPWPAFPIQYPHLPGLDIVISRRWPRLVVDLNADGQPEIVGAGWGGSLPSAARVQVHDLEGSTVPGWPTTLPGLFGSAQLHLLMAGDIDGDGADELVLDVRPSSGKELRLIAIDGDGTLLWDKEFDFFGYGVTLATYSGGMAIGDLDFDGESEIVVHTQVHNAFGSAFLGITAYALDQYGDPKPGWPRQFIDGLEPVIADLDGDGASEIISMTYPWGIMLRAMDGSVRIPGTLGNIPTYPQVFGNLGLVTADLDGDGTLEIVYPGQELEVIRAFVNVDLLADPTQPYSESLALTSPLDEYGRYDGIAVADVNGDGVHEILAMSRSGPTSQGPRYVHIYEQDLVTELPGWPKEVPFEPFGTVPWINGYGPVTAATQVIPTDLDGDGDLEVLYRSGGQIWAWDIPQVPNSVPIAAIEWQNYLANDKWNHWYHEGRVPKFRPGDFNGDDVLDLSDPIGALSYLFASGASGDCPAAIDVDGSGTETIGDPILLLGYLFVAGSPPPAGGPCATRAPSVGTPCERRRCP